MNMKLYRTSMIVIWVAGLIGLGYELSNDKRCFFITTFILMTVLGLNAWMNTFIKPRTIENPE